MDTDPLSSATKANPARGTKDRIVLEDTVYASSDGDLVGLSVPFSIVTSHQIKEADFSGANAITWQVPYEHAGIRIADFGPFQLTIRGTPPGKYSLELASDAPFASDKAEVLLVVIQQNLTFLLNRQNPNPHYGTYFIDLDIAECRFIHSTPGARISDHLSIRSEGIYQSQADDWPRSADTQIMKYYFDGARAGDSKSKYFQWFRIIEHLEGSKKYLNGMGWHPFFTAEEQGSLNKFADSFKETNKETRKSSAIRELLKRTLESRAEKLAAFLKYLGISEYGRPGHEIGVDAESLKSVIAARNRLFHAGSTLDEALLWGHLFPLATTVTEVDRRSPLLLD
jgi:hypothetical protein